MRKLSEKLHSRRGASILLALMYLLVSVFIGAVALGSATTSAQKTQERREDQQTYLAVSSAAKLLRDAMAGDRCKVVEEKAVCTYSGCGEAFGPKCSANADFPIDGTKTDILTDAAWAIYQTQTHYVASTGSAPYEKEFFIEAEGLPKVQCSMIMEADYDVTFRLRALEEDGTTPLAVHALTLTFDGEGNGAETTTSTSCFHNTGVDPVTGEAFPVEYTLTHYTYTTNISWPNVAIEKGVASDAP